MFKIKRFGIETEESELDEFDTNNKISIDALVKRVNERYQNAQKKTVKGNASQSNQIQNFRTPHKLEQHRKKRRRTQPFYRQLYPTQHEQKTTVTHKKSLVEEKTPTKVSEGVPPGLGTERENSPSLDYEINVRYDRNIDEKDNSDAASEYNQEEVELQIKQNLQKAPSIQRAFAQLQQFERANIYDHKTKKDIATQGIDRDNSENANVIACCEKWGIHQQITENLTAQLKIKDFFGIQRRAIPLLLNSSNTRDACIFAPTGSGKTLAFVIPVVQGLVDRVLIRLRALILLPTRELADQVAGVFETCCCHTGLRVYCCNGQMSLELERKKLVNRVLGQSRVDILVSTPGRLLDHVKLTEGFTLMHLRFLVIDEADKLFSQSYNEWLKSLNLSLASKNHKWPPFIKRNGIRKINPRTFQNRTDKSLYASCPDGHSLRKILCSATLAQDPQKFAALNLKQPYYVTELAGERDFDVNVEITPKFTLPETLNCYMVLCTRANKPLALMHLLCKLGDERVLIFTRSLEATHRLYLLLKAFGRFKVSELSSRQPPRIRASIIENFASRETLVLVSSDIMARGIDIESLENVVNYDVPLHVKTLVHRAGRTARAGRVGSCYTLLHADQGRHYRKLHAEVCKKPTLIKTNADEFEAFKEDYKNCLIAMKESVKQNRGD